MASSSKPCFFVIGDTYHVNQALISKMIGESHESHFILTPLEVIRSLIHHEETFFDCIEFTCDTILPNDYPTIISRFVQEYKPFLIIYCFNENSIIYPYHKNFIAKIIRDVKTPFIFAGVDNISFEKSEEIFNLIRYVNRQENAKRKLLTVDLDRVENFIIECFSLLPLEVKKIMYMCFLSVIEDDYFQPVLERNYADWLKIMKFFENLVGIFIPEDVADSIFNYLRFDM